MKLISLMLFGARISFAEFITKSPQPLTPTAGYNDLFVMMAKMTLFSICFKLQLKESEQGDVYATGIAQYRFARKMHRI